MHKLIEVNGYLVTFGFGTIGSILIWGIKLMVNALKGDRENIERRIDILEASNVALLGDKIFHLCRSYLKRDFGGWVTIEERQNLDRIFKSYESSGGNSTAKQLYQKTTGLPYSREEAKRLYENIKN